MSPSQYLGIPDEEPEEPEQPETIPEVADTIAPEPVATSVEHIPRRASLIQRTLGSKGIKMVTSYIGAKVTGQRSAR